MKFRTLMTQIKPRWVISCMSAKSSFTHHNLFTESLFESLKFNRHSTIITAMNFVGDFDFYNQSIFSDQNWLGLGLLY
jgi:hypothetical protein